MIDLASPVSGCGERRRYVFEIDLEQIETEYLFRQIDATQRRRLFESTRLDQLKNIASRQKPQRTALASVEVIGAVVGSEPNIKIVYYIFPVQHQATGRNLVPVLAD